MRHLAVVSLTLFLFTTASQSFAGSVYSIESLGALGSGASGISSGSVGFYTSSGGNQTPAAFSSNGITTLSGSGQASGQNGSGVIVGTTYSGNTPYVTEWVNGQSETWGLKGYGNAINNAGQIGGAYLASNGNTHAFIQTGSTVRDLGTLGGNWSTVNALNSSGQAAGTATTAAGAFNAFLWNGSSLTDLGTLGGVNSYGNAINSEGQVAGASQSSAGYLNAFVTKNGTLLDLGTLGGTTSAAYGINDMGEVVGYSLTANGATHAFVDENGIMWDLNSLLPSGSGYTITAAYALDNNGDILATALNDGQEYAVELQQNMPGCDAAGASIGAPEPAAMALAGIGFLTIAVFGRRRRIQRPDRFEPVQETEHGKLQV